MTRPVTTPSEPSARLGQIPPRLCRRLDALCRLVPARIARPVAGMSRPPPRTATRSRSAIPCAPAAVGFRAVIEQIKRNIRVRKFSAHAHLRDPGAPI